MAKLLLLAVIALVAFLAPGKEGVPVLSALRTQAPIVVVGNSVIRGRSICDQDLRTIPAMLAEVAGAEVLDLSKGGQTLEQSANLAAVALRNPRVARVVVALSPFAFADHGGLGLQEALMFRTVNPALEAAPLAPRIVQGTLLSGAPPVSRQAFHYKGVDYPDYEGVKRTFFGAEKQAMRCPESDGANARFVEAFHAFNYVQLPVDAAAVSLLASLNALAAPQRSRLSFTMLPVDYELMARFDPDLAAAARSRTAALLARLRAQGIDVLDLSAAAPNEAFADRWCACGHLNAAGRLRVAQGLVAGQPQASAGAPTGTAASAAPAAPMVASRQDGRP